MCPNWMQGGVWCACLTDAANEWLLTFLEMNTHQRESPVRRRMTPPREIAHPVWNDAGNLEPLWALCLPSSEALGKCCG